MSPNQIIIREAITTDAKDIAGVSIKAWQESYQGILDQDILDNLSLENRLQIRQQILKEQPQGHFVACDDHKIIGFCDAGPARFEFAKGEIYAIYILNDYKGLGVGFQLFAFAKKYLYKKNLQPFLAMALSQNKPARAFYERQGGTICGENVYKVADKTYPEVCYLFK